MRGVGPSVDHLRTVNGARNTALEQLEQKPRASSFGQRIRSLFSRGRQEPPPAVQQQAPRAAFGDPLNARVKPDGKLVANNSLAGQAIEKQLNQEGKSYEHARPTPTGMLFQDSDHNGYHLQQTPAAIGVFKSSVTGEQPNNPALRFGQVDFKSVPSHAHLAQVGGVHTDRAGQQFRMVNGKKMEFHTGSGTWRPAADPKEYKRLIHTGSGDVVGVPKGVQGLARVDSRTAILLDPGKSKIRLSDGAGANGSVHNLRFQNRPVEATRVGLSQDGQVLYLANKDGDLFAGNAATAAGRDINLHQVDLSQHPAGQALGRLRVEGFVNDDRGDQLNALVRDRHEQLHACPFDRTRDELHPGWNLTDALVMTKDEGLSKPQSPAADRSMDLGARGKVALHEGRLFTWNEVTQGWTPTKHHLEKMDRGTDGKVYGLQKGELKALEVNTSGENLRAGASHDLSPSGRRTVANMGSTLAGSATNRLKSFSVADAKHFVTVGQDDLLRVHVDGRERTFELPGGHTEIQSLAMDHKQNLYLQTGDGQVHRLDKACWQSLYGDAAWHQVASRDNRPADPASLRIGPDYQPLANFDGQEHRLPDKPVDVQNPWKPAGSPEIGPDLQAHLARHHKPGKIGNTSINVSSNFLGQTSEGVKADRSFRTGLRSHFHPLDSISQKGRDIQQHFKGRAGEEMQSIYADERELLRRLPVMADPAAQQPDNLEARLNAIQLPPRAQPLLEAMQGLRGDIEKSTREGTERLGQLHGVIDEQGHINNDFRPSRMDRLRARLDLGGRHQVTGELNSAFNAVAPDRGPAGQPPSDRSKTRDLLGEFQNRNLHLSRHREGKTRDLGDRSALVKDQLILDMHTLSELHSLARDMEQQLHGRGDATVSQATLQALGARFDDISARYKGSDIRRAISSNITNHRQLETVYDQYKRTGTELGTKRHALNLNARNALGVNAEDIGPALVGNVRGMNSGDSVSVARTRETAVNTPWISGPIPFLYGSAGGSKGDSIGLSLGRTDDGADVKVSGGNSFSMNVMVAAGQAFGFVQGNGVALGAFAGAELTGTYGRSRDTDVTMSVTDGNLDRVAQNLTDPNGKLTEFLSLGTDHAVSESHKQSFDLDLWVGGDIRANYGNTSPAPATAYIRTALAGVAGNVNLLHTEGSKSQSMGADGEISQTEARFRDNIQGLRKGDVGIFNRPVQGMTSVQAGGKDGANMLARSPVEISLKVSLDRTRSKSFDLSFKLAQPVEKDDVKSLLDDLRRDFPSHRGTPALTAMNDGQTVAQKLAQIDTWAQGLANAGGAFDDDQYQSIHQAKSLHIQQGAADRKERQFVSAETSVSLSSLRSKSPLPASLHTNGKHAWLDGVSDQNAREIQALLSREPRYAGLVETLESGKATDTKVVFELRDSVRRDIEQRCAAGEDVDQLLRQSLTDRSNLRVKSISIKDTRTQSHAMATPPLLIGFSSKASLSQTITQGKLDFKYGHDDQRPMSISPDGAIAKSGISNDLILSMNQEENVTMHLVANKPDLSMANPDRSMNAQAGAGRNHQGMQNNRNRGGVGN